MPDDIFDKVAAKPPKQDIFDRVAAPPPAVSPEQAQINQLPNPAAQSKQQLLASQPALTTGQGLYPQSMDRSMATRVPSNMDSFDPDEQKRLIESGVSPSAAMGSNKQQALGVGGMLAAGNPGATAVGTAGGAIGNPLLQAISSAMGAKPAAAKMWGTTGEIIGGLTGGEFGGRLESVAAKQLGRLFGETPERLRELAALPQTEEAIRQRVVQSEVQSRTAFKSAYDSLGIDAAPVNVTNARRVAQSVAEDLKAVAPVPKGVSRVGAMPGPAIPNEFFEEPELQQVMKEMTANDNVPFRRAQQFRSSIEQYISKNKPDAVTYNALKKVSGALDSALDSTAVGEGKKAGYDAANAMFKQHAADYWNKGAPLKSFLQVPADATGATLGKFQQVATQGRALEALERRGVPTQDLRGILAKTPERLKADLRDAATLKNLGTDVLNKQVAGRNRITTAKIGAGLSGLGALYDVLRRMSPAQHP